MELFIKNQPRICHGYSPILPVARFDKLSIKSPADIQIGLGFLCIRTTWRNPVRRSSSCITRLDPGHISLPGSQCLRIYAQKNTITNIMGLMGHRSLPSSPSSPSPLQRCSVQGTTELFKRFKGVVKSDGDRCGRKSTICD